MQKGLAREDLFTVVHDPFMTDTAKYADIVLPAASYLETDDLYRAYGAYWMQWGRQAAKPARRGALQLRRGAGAGPAHGPHRQDLHACRRRTPRRNCSRARPVPRPKADPAKLFAGEPIHIAHDWDGQPFKTPSGKLEFYSEQLAKQGLSPMPDWEPDPIEAAEAAQVAAAPADRARLLPGPHRLLGRRLPAQARGQAVLHPPSRGRRRSAASRTATQVRLFNDRGEIGLMLKVSRRGPARRPAGARPAPDRRGRLRHDQHALLRPLHRHGRRRDLPEHLARRRPVESRKPGRCRVSQWDSGLRRRKQPRRQPNH